MTMNLRARAQEVFQAEIKPRLALISENRPKISTADMEAVIKDWRPEILFTPEEDVDWPWETALIRLSVYDPDIYSFKHQLDVYYQPNKKYIVSSPALSDNETLSPEDSLKFWGPWTNIEPRDGGGPFWVNVAGWDQLKESTVNNIRFQQDYRETQMRRIESLQRLSFQLLARTKKPPPEISKVKKDFRPTTDTKKDFRPTTDTKKDPNLQTKGDSLGLGLLGGLLLLFLVTRGK